MARITIDIDGLRQDASNLSKQIADIEKQIRDLQMLLALMGDSWDGTAATATIAKIREEINSLKRIVTLLKQFQKYIENTIRRFNEADNQLAKRINGSF